MRASGDGDLGLIVSKDVRVMGNATEAARAMVCAGEPRNVQWAVKFIF